MGVQVALMDSLFEGAAGGGLGPLIRPEHWMRGSSSAMSADAHNNSMGGSTFLMSTRSRSHAAAAATSEFHTQQPRPQAVSDQSEEVSRVLTAASSFDELCGAESSLRLGSGGDEEEEEGPSDGAARASKKPKLEWTDDLHRVFVTAVEGLAPEAQVPSRILGRMGHWAVGLTRANIASHLQKYRRKRNDYQAASAGAAPQQPSSYAAGGIALGVPCSPLMRQAAAAVPPPHRAGLAVPWAGAAPGPAASSWVPQGLAPPGPDTFSAPALMGQWPLPALRPPSAAELDRILGDFARDGCRGRPPIGLKLDCAAVMHQLNGTALRGAAAGAGSSAAGAWPAVLRSRRA